MNAPAWAWAMCRECGVESELEFCPECVQRKHYPQKFEREKRKAAERDRVFLDNKRRELRINPNLDQ